MLLISSEVRGLLTGLDVAPDAIKTLTDALQAAEELLASERFTHVQLSPTVFGGSTDGARLGEHHGRAHRVMSETLRGVRDDLVRFAEAANYAVNAVAEADSTSAADLKVREEAAAVVATSFTQDEGGEKRQEAQNDAAVNAPPSPAPEGSVQGEGGNG